MNFYTATSLTLKSKDVSSSSINMAFLCVDRHNFNCEKTLSTDADEGTHSAISFKSFPHDGNALYLGIPVSAFVEPVHLHHSIIA